MTEYELADDSYIAATPVGAYYAVSGPEEEPSRKLFDNLAEVYNN